MMDTLERATGFFRHRIARSLDLRFAPEMRFVLDHAIEKGERFLQALEQVHAEEQQQMKKGHQRMKGKNE
jgi:ribosome-binding factor A